MSRPSELLKALQERSYTHPSQDETAEPPLFFKDYPTQEQAPTIPPRDQEVLGVPVFHHVVKAIEVERNKM
jgi:hypothetical protein